MGFLILFFVLPMLGLILLSQNSSCQTHQDNPEPRAHVKSWGERYLDAMHAEESRSTPRALDAAIALKNLLVRLFTPRQ